MRFTHGTWYFWVLLGWGVGIAFQVRSVVFPQASLERRKRHEQRRALKDARRAEREARRQRFAKVFGAHDGNPALHAAQARNEFETAVQTGVAALLQVAARKIHEHTPSARRTTARALVDGAKTRVGSLRERQRLLTVGDRILILVVVGVVAEPWFSGCFVVLGGEPIDCIRLMSSEL